jgi:hypothetical protein
MAFAQKAEVEEKVQPNSLHPGYTKKKYYAPRHVKASKYRRPKVTHTARYEFYERVEEAAKRKQKLLKKLAKPQFSDFSYFGHKQKPKKRKPHKMRYCKECGIRH